VGELEERGYKVRGQGARFVYGERGWARRWLAFLPLWMVVSHLVAPVLYFWPQRAMYMVGWKKVQGGLVKGNFSK